MAAFYELNIFHEDRKSSQAKILQAYKLGYSVVALNVVMKDIEQEPQGKKLKKKSNQKVSEISKADLDYLTSLVDNENFHVLKRLTLNMVDANISLCHNLISQVGSFYDLVAVMPTTDKTFHHACMNLNVNIITFNVNCRSTFRCTPSNVRVAVKRGIFFEICYSPCIKDSSIRTFTINTACEIISICKGKNVILSSGAEYAIDIRGPYDVANLGLLFGMSEVQSKDATSINGRTVVNLAKTKYMAKETILVEMKPGGKESLNDETSEEESSDAAQPSPKRLKLK